MYLHTVQEGETLPSIAADYRVSLTQLLQQNAGVNPTQLQAGQTIRIPGLPDPRTIPYTIRVSIHNHTLTLLQNGAPIRVYPIAVGRMVTMTPVGSFVIVNRQPNPGGPFGTMWLSLSKLHYGIHGTNDPASIGHSVSHGCIRMHNADVNELASIVPNGTRVTIES
ncbi:L,D-transpeptidase family protein [Geomicrobium sp. JCM 19039]|uniref:L,D-transpeptidase family protein n=1 Tax=Geomicrobium sp. JCM 19039 TaxID=1460636 RepID=UPI00045F3642|nr:L,D-transpeptidase family protein [Geomicrobium sp. JCM 19039]GAK13550.1 ErfK/SrfK protein precursor [Geomicrobium sp. JCM 19039]